MTAQIVATSCPASMLLDMQVLAGRGLLPAAWSHFAVENSYLFNPAVTCFAGQYLMAYRVVTPDGRRRLAICRLTPELEVIPQSAVPLSDSIQNGGEWQADPRFCTVDGRLYLHYNNSARYAESAIYLVEIDPGGLWAAGPARRLVLAGPQRQVEKNWMLFEHEDRLLAVYSIAPHLILELELRAEGDVLCRPAYRAEWDVSGYARRYGEPRGGAPPLRVGDMYVSVFHSAFHVGQTRSLLYRMLGKTLQHTMRYVAGAYAFKAAPPFEPLWMHPFPVLTPPRRLRRAAPQLDPRVERVVYPCGSMLVRGQWVVSFGADNEYCCLSALDSRVLPRHLAGSTRAASDLC